MLKPALALFAVAAIVTALLGLSHAVTLEPIETQLRRTKENTKKEMLSQAIRFEDVDTEVTGSIVKVYRGFDADGPVGYVVELSPQGYAGAIDMMVGISSVENVLAGIRVTKHSETPGLGALAARESFYDQFDGKAPVPLKVIKGGEPGDDEIDTITSATITTRAITDAVNEATAWYIANG
jgi:electron transport complex protein RnfG